ncbi:MAG: hypothetical protein U0905_01720 [Pirellulales bacterium]
MAKTMKTPSTQPSNSKPSPLPPIEKKSIPTSAPRSTTPPSIPVPPAPETPEDWQHDPFQDDTRSNRPINRYKMEGIPTHDLKKFTHAFDPQAFIRKQKEREADLSIAQTTPAQPQTRSLRDQAHTSTENENSVKLHIGSPDSNVSQASSIITVATFDATQRVSNSIRRSLSDESTTLPSAITTADLVEEADDEPPTSEESASHSHDSTMASLKKATKKFLLLDIPKSR